MAPNLRQPESLANLCNRAMIVYLWNLPKPMMTIVGTTVPLPPSCVTFLQNYFECRIPPIAYDGLRDEFNKFMKNAYTVRVNDGIKRTSFLLKVSVYAPVWRTIILDHCEFMDFRVIPWYLHNVYWGGLERMTSLRTIYIFAESRPLFAACRENVRRASTIVRCIAHWPELRYFRKNDCVDAILLALSDSCPKLVFLDVSYSIRITDVSVDILRRFRELKCLQIHSTSLTSNGYRRLMDCLPRLERLNPCGVWPDYTLEHYPIGRTFALTHYYGGFHFSTNKLRFLTTHCPNICFISICRCDYVSDLCDLRYLCAIEKMSSLRLVAYQFHTHNIRDVLQVKGANLVYLELKGVGELDMNSLILISKYCPNLVELILEIRLVDNMPSHYVERVEHPFQHLKQLWLSGLFGMDHLEYLLGDCFNIERIRIDIWPNALILDDRTIDRILATNPLQHVRFIHIWSACNLTIVGAQRLVDACPELRILGSVLRWNVTEVDRETFKCYLREHNYAVVLE